MTDGGPSAQRRAVGEQVRPHILLGQGPAQLSGSKQLRVATKHEPNGLASRAGGSRSCYRPWASRPHPDPGVSFQALRSAPQGWGDVIQPHASPQSSLTGSLALQRNLLFCALPAPLPRTLCSSWGHFHLLSAHHAPCYIISNSSLQNPHNSLRGRTVLSPGLQMRTQQLKENGPLAHGHGTCQWHSWDSNPARSSGCAALGFSPLHRTYRGACHKPPKPRVKPTHTHTHTHPVQPADTSGPFPNTYTLLQIRGFQTCF